MLATAQREYSKYQDGCTNDRPSPGRPSATEGSITSWDEKLVGANPKLSLEAIYEAL